MSNVVQMNNSTETQALWNYISDLTNEIQTLKSQMQRNNSASHRNHRYNCDEYFTFIATLRKKMKAKVDKNHYPTIQINGMTLGIDFKGLLYNKKTQKILPKDLAFDVYHVLYDHHLDKPYF